MWQRVGGVQRGGTRARGQQRQRLASARRSFALTGDNLMSNDEKIASLLAAGRLLQSKQWPGGKREIERLPGESYPEAVLRVIRSLDESERSMLRELVHWVRDYERADEC